MVLTKVLAALAFLWLHGHSAAQESHASEGEDVPFQGADARRLTSSQTCSMQSFRIAEMVNNGCEITSDGCVQTLAFPTPYPLNSSCWIQKVDAEYFQMEWYIAVGDGDWFETDSLAPFGESFFLNGYYAALSPAKTTFRMFWTSDGVRSSESELGWRFCPRRHCEAMDCPAGWQLKSIDPTVSPLNLLCAGQFCDTEADIEKCCTLPCMLESPAVYAERNLQVSATTGIADCSEGAVVADECRIQCQAGYEVHGTLAQPSSPTCNDYGQPWDVPTCLSQDFQVPWTDYVYNPGESQPEHHPCRRQGRDCMTIWSWPSGVVPSDDERCNFQLQGDFVVEMQYFGMGETHTLDINGYIFSGADNVPPPPLYAGDGLHFQFDYPSSTDTAGSSFAGFYMCVFGSCNSYTCPNGYVFNCSAAYEACGSAVCGEYLEADVATCCQVASPSEIEAGLANSSDAYSSGCLVRQTTELTTSTTTTIPRQVVGLLQLQVAGAYISDEANQEAVRSALESALWIGTGLVADPNEANSSSTVNNASRRLTGQAYTPEVWIIAANLPEPPLPTELVWQVGFYVINLGETSAVLEAMTADQLQSRLQAALGTDIAVASLDMISRDAEGAPLVSSVLTATGANKAVPYCTDEPGWIDDYQLQCSTWDTVCTRYGTSNGFLESLGDPFFTWEVLLPRANADQPTAVDACCGCGGGICTPGSFIMRGVAFGSGSPQTPEFCAPCRPGTTSNDHDLRDCTPCPVGRISPISGGTFCQLTGAGTYANITGLAEGIPCPLGTFMPDRGATECNLCSPGTFQDETGKSICESCPPGRFADVNGSTACMPCPEGTFADEEGRDSCDLCPPGSHNDGTGQSVCRPCDTGNFAGEPGLILCEACLVGTYADERGQSACDPCEPGTAIGAEAALFCDPCLAGTFAGTAGSSACTDCHPGTYFPGLGAEACLDCEAGSYSDVGQSLCDPCAAGSFAADTGKSLCDDCAEGSYSPLSGLSECVFCPTGRVAATPGLPECIDCRPGSYADATGMTSCISCASVLPGNGEYWTTMRLTPPDDNGDQEWDEYDGASSVAECGCMPGTQPDGAAQINFTHGGSPEDPLNGRGRGCVPCHEGLTCLGMGQMRVWKDYAWDGELSTYDCEQATVEACPGGVPGVCKAGRDIHAVACAECMSKMVARNDGTCEECGGADYLVPSIFMAVVVVAVCFGYYLFDSPKRKRPSLSTLILVASAGQLLTIIQQLGIVASIRVTWKSPLRRLFAIVSEIGFLDIDLLRPQCVTALRPVNKYALRIFAVFIALLIVCFAHVLSALIQHRHRWQKRFPVLFCAIGTIVMAFFVSIVTTTLGPLQCKLHPNEKRTVSWYPSVLCWESDAHSALLGIGLLACIVPVTFMVASTWAVKVFKAKLLQADSKFLTAWAFLVFRYHGEAFWYGPVLLLRNALVSVAPTMASPVLQIVFLQVVMLVSLICVCRVMPWRAQLANYIDVLIHIVILFVTMVAAFYVEQLPSDGLATTAMICILLLPTILLVMILITQYKKWRQTKRKKYHFFLCHHKAGAGCFARLMKMRLLRQKGIKGKVFVDTDDLKNLDNLFDMVAAELDTLVVIHSDYVLTRPWCIGEIVTTHMHKVHLQVLRISGVENVTNDFIENFGNYVPDYSALTERGISLDNIQEALKWLQSFHVIRLPKELLDITVDNAANALIKNIAHKESLDLDQGKEPAHMEREEQVVIIADKKDLEAEATAFIMKDLINPVLSHEFHKLAFVLPDSIIQLPPPVTKAVLICTNGVFNGAHFEVLLSLSAKHCVLMPVMATSNFRFPTPQVLADIPDMYDFEEDDQERIMLLVQSIFTEIAVDFQPAGLSATEAALAAKAKEVAERLYSKNMANLNTKMELMVNKTKVSQDSIGSNPSSPNVGATQSALSKLRSSGSTLGLQGRDRRPSAAGRSSPDEPRSPGMDSVKENGTSPQNGGVPQVNAGLSSEGTQGTRRTSRHSRNSRKRNTGSQPLVGFIAPAAAKDVDVHVISEPDYMEEKFVVDC